MTIRLAALNVYPVKSCRGIAITRALLTEAGIEHDREWMIVSTDGRFLTQREEPRLALIEPALDGDQLRLAAAGAGAVEVPFDDPGTAVEVLVWRDRCRARDLGDRPARWVSDFLGRPLRLVRFDPAHRRTSDPHWTGNTTGYTRFSDGYALLAISLASLGDLNARLPAPLPMNRFRPNLVLDGLDAYGEDHVGELCAGPVRLRRVKPCTRCVITTTDQATGNVDGDEPLRTLRQYRWNRELRGVAFGQNLIVAGGAGEELYEDQTFTATGGP